MLKLTIREKCQALIMKFLWPKNLNYIVSFQFLVIAKDVHIEGLQKRSWCKVENFIPFHCESWFHFLKQSLKFSCHYYDLMKYLNVPWCSWFIVLKCCNNIWICIGMGIHRFNIEEMVHGMVALQEQYGIMINNI